MLGSVVGLSEAAGPVVPQEKTQDTTLELNPVHGGPAPHCFAAGMGGDVGAVDEPQGAAAGETDLGTGAGASGRGLEDGSLGALQDRGLVRDLEEVAGYRVGNPEEERGDGSSHPDGLATGRGGSAGGGDGGERWGGDGGDDGCYCCCSGGGCCGRGGGGESGGLFGPAGASLEDCDGYEQVCGISLACSGGVVCGWAAAPMGEWEMME